MNREFVRKMLQAKQLEYNAIKEILPEGMRKRVEEFEQEAKELAFDLVLGAQTQGSDHHEKSCRKVEVD